MKTVKKKWGRIVGIVLAAIMLICLITSGLFYWRVKHSILRETGIRRMLETKGIYLGQGIDGGDGLNESDRRKMFMILAHTQKYDKHKDQPYLLDGAFLSSPKICFPSDPGERGDYISWEYHEGIFVYYYPGNKLKHSCKYYLGQKYAQELRMLFDKYTLPDPHYHASL